jgi:drug/metabolite transporter (DMT)-like permease
LTCLQRAHSSNRAAPIGLLVISSALWGSAFVSIKIGLAYVNVYDFAFLRLAAASIALLVPLCSRGFKLSLLKESSVWAMGLLNGIGFTLQYLGLLFTTAAKTALLVDLNVIAVAILSWRLFEETMGARKFLGVILGVSGAVIITTNGDLSTLARGELLGDVLVLAAGLAWAVFIVLHKRILMQKERDTMELSGMVMLTTTVLLFPASVILGGLDIGKITLQGWGWIGFIAVACTVVPYALWVAALKAVTATVAAIMGMLEIVVAMVVSAIVLGETYGTVTLFGAALILLSILAVAES